MKGEPRSWRTAVGVLLLLLGGLEFVLKMPLLLGAAALYQRDLFLLYFPLVQSVLRSVSEGALPLRDITSGFGQPLLGDPSCQILYPPVLLHLVLPPHLAYAWFVSLHSVFGALGVGLLARRLASGSWSAAAVGGALWLLSGPLQSLATLWHHMSGAAWIPWVLLCVLRVVDREPRAPRWLGAVFGLQILAGSADMCAMTVLLAALFIPLGDYLGSARAWFQSAALGLALSAGAWLPAAELAANSARATLSLTARTFWSLHPVTALEFFLPVPWSAFPLRSEWREALFEGREPFLGSMFMGALILPLGVAALLDGQIPRLRRIACLVAAAGGFAIALGKHAAAYSFAVTLIPPLQILRFPSKAMIPVAVILCALAGAGVASLARSDRSRRGSMIASALLAFSAAALAGPLFGTFLDFFMDASRTDQIREVFANLPRDLVISMGMLGLLILFLRRPAGRAGILIGTVLFLGHVYQSVHIHAGFNPTVATSVLAYRPDHLDLLKPPGGGRLYVYDYSLFKGRAFKYLGREAGALVQGLDALTPEAAAMVAARAYLSPLTGAFWGIEYAWDGDLRMLFDRRLSALTTGLRRVEGTPGLLKLLQLSGVSRVAALHDQGLKELRLLQTQKVFFAEDLRVFEVPDSLPRAFLVTGRRRTTGDDLRDLMDLSFDHRRSVLVDSGAVREPALEFEGAATITERRADRLVVQSSANHPAFLTVIEGMMPGWRAWVDGVPARVERANGAFIGVEVPAGTHRVEFRFLPATAVFGVSLSIGAGLLLILLWLRERPSPNQAEAPLFL